MALLDQIEQMVEDDESGLPTCVCEVWRYYFESSEAKMSQSFFSDQIDSPSEFIASYRRENGIGMPEAWALSAVFPQLERKD